MSCRQKTLTIGAAQRRGVCHLIQSRSGVTSIEYGLIAALVTLALLGGAQLMFGSVGALFDDSSAIVENSMPANGDTSSVTP